MTQQLFKICLFCFVPPPLKYKIWLVFNSVAEDNLDILILLPVSFEPLGFLLHTIPSGLKPVCNVVSSFSMTSPHGLMRIWPMAHVICFVLDPLCASSALPQFCDKPPQSRPFPHLCWQLCRDRILKLPIADVRAGPLLFSQDSSGHGSHLTAFWGFYSAAVNNIPIVTTKKCPMGAKLL